MHPLGKAKRTSAPLVRGAAASDELTHEEIELLYRQFSSAILTRCRQILRDEELAWDAMHQTFVNAIRHRKSFRADAQPLTWLYSISFRVCLDTQKRRRRRQERLRFDTEPPPSDDGNAEHWMLQACTVSKLLHFFDRRTQEVVVLRYFDELDLDEIAQVVGQSRRTVTRRLSKFRERAREIVEQHS